MHEMLKQYDEKKFTATINWMESSEGEIIKRDAGRVGLQISTDVRYLYKISYLN